MGRPYTGAGGIAMSDPQVIGQLVSCLADIEQDLQNAEQYSSAVMVGQSIELIEALQFQLAAVTDDRDGAQQTHHEECWRNPRHHACAVAKIERLQSQLDTIQAPG